MTKTDTSRSLLDRITGRRADMAKVQAEIAELEREARWAQGAERRARLAACAADAQQLIDEADQTAAELDEAAAAVTNAVRHLANLAAASNAAVEDVRQRIAKEKPTGNSGFQGGSVPPSPTDAGVGLAGSSVIVGETRLNPIDGLSLIERAVNAGKERGLEAPSAPPITTSTPMPAGPYWRSRTSGNVLSADHQPNGDCESIHKVEYLASAWGIPVRDLPAEMLDELTPAERAKLATQLLPQDGDAA